MENKLSSIVYEWLSHCHIRVSRRYLHSRLASHYAYPSILSITDLFDEWGFENAAVMVDKENLDHLPRPYLIETKDGNYLLIKDLKKDFPKEPDFLSNWNGLVLFMEPPAKFHEPENLKLLQKENSEKKALQWGAVILLITLSIGLYFHFNWTAPGLLIISIAGLLISILSIQQNLGIDNKLAGQICMTGNKANCAAISNSPQSKIAGDISFADLSLTWFSSCTIAFTIGLFTNLFFSVSEIVSLFILVAIPVTLISIYYQRWVIRSWCPLCVITIALVWLQAAILIPGLSLRFYPELLSHLTFAILMATAILISWIRFLKPIIIKNLSLAEENFKLKRFKNNPAVFEWALKRKHPVDATPWEDDLQIGNRLSPIQIFVACNPYCHPCAAVHKILHELAERKEIGLTIRFSLANTDLADPITEAAAYILRVLKDKPATYKRKALEQWYATMEMDKFSKQYPMYADAEIESSLSRLVKWSEKSGIRYTPTIFINGHQLPGMYHPTDLSYLLNYVIINSENGNRKNESVHQLEIS